jgi:hypothetical protein
VDPLQLLLEKDTYVRAAKQAASYAGIAKAELVRATEAAAEAAVAKAKAAAQAAINPPKLPEFKGPPPSRRGPAPDALLRAARAGNNYESADVLGLALGRHSTAAAVAAAPLEPAIKPAVDFAYMMQRSTDAMRLGGGGAATTLTASLHAPQPTQPKAAMEGTDPILQATAPTFLRKPHTEGLENYNFCSDVPAATPTHAVPLRCVREAFREAGGSEGGLAWPAERVAVDSPEFYEQLYMLPTWADMKIYIQTLAARVKSLDAEVQGRARAALGVPEPAGVPGVEVFARAGADRMLVGRRIVDRLPLSMGTFVNYAGSADFLAVCRLRPVAPRRIRWFIAATAGMIIVANKELWDFEVGARDEPADFRRLRSGTATSEAVTIVPAATDTFVRALWSASPEDRVEMVDAAGAGAAAGVAAAGPAPLTGFLTQDPRAPMLRFAVYSRERPAPPAGTYANPQFVGTFGSGRRWEEARNPDIFYSLTNGVEIDNRRTGGLESTAAFYSRSFWQCTTPISPMAWRSITFTVRFEQLPTAGEQPMRCVATAYPFFVYIAYTPAGPGYEQGVYFYLYRLKGAAYTFCSRMPVERARWYHVCLSFKEGQPGDVALSVRSLGGGNSSSQADHASLRIDDDVFYRPVPAEGGSAPHMPMISLGFHKYGGGIPGFTGHVRYFHVFDYLLGAADYTRDLEGRWDIKWFN